MESRDELLICVKKEAEAAGWGKPDHVVVAAVSGGPDSMALLHLLLCIAAERPFRLVAAHVNHRFRGAEAQAEAELVAGTAAKWGVPLESAAIDVPSYIEETGMNAQAAAREKRYEFLRTVAERHGATHLMFGHHADDQAETVLMRVLRGTGIGGLAGIPYRRKEGNLELLRPLLRIPKWELQAYCERNGIPFAIDSSNLSRKYFRNAVRLDLLPMLESYNPRLKESLIRLAEMAEADDDYLEAETARVLARMSVRAGQGFRLERSGFRGLHVALQRRLIKLILSYSVSPSHFREFRQIEEILQAAADDRPSVTRIDIGNGWRFVREYDELYIGPEPPNRTGFRYEVTEPESALSMHAGDSGTVFEFQRLEGAVSSPPDNRWEAFFDASKLVWPLSVRSREPGDRMEPCGLNGSKKVQDMFVDAKVPRSKRGQWPLVADAQGRILWIPGLRRSRIALVGADTRSTIRIAVRETDADPRTRT
ncbi:tRNA lysidine(34) synthetase TilS [Cohnella pontilimi]|uniref:tRNA(Ile)-lysidine synthase n=1 Tax=Cohnella pontilimi TaxID=2564100 RepID=A0A4U0F299_9BACL|nr:tRNA lysidine(34) synthetase TilS [Cohnella pontilimi]TJY38553.1 tRNA lysidine(34) synthetase TilS [Cohnella pontilimi]